MTPSRWLNSYIYLFKIACGHNRIRKDWAMGLIQPFMKTFAAAGLTTQSSLALEWTRKACLHWNLLTDHTRRPCTCCMSRMSNFFKNNWWRAFCTIWHSMWSYWRYQNDALIQIDIPRKVCQGATDCWTCATIPNGFLKAQGTHNNLQSHWSSIACNNVKSSSSSCKKTSCNTGRIEVALVIEKGRTNPNCHHLKGNSLNLSLLWHRGVLPSVFLTVVWSIHTYMSTGRMGGRKSWNESRTSVPCRRKQGGIIVSSNFKSGHHHTNNVKFQAAKVCERLTWR